MFHTENRVVSLSSGAESAFPFPLLGYTFRKMGILMFARWLMKNQRTVKLT
jgi:hypothetical protein